ncbi:hypothetical protein MmiHf6_10340 [Methanimicrococcus hongohii]|uniref:DUF1894 domain-containing protein n=1 Tax=Methanimicrococcus hongohii TaxID=3028295 RepID=A0AA96ZSS4_9EURY|nr:DUF1894 domain-containing protein [Methanimicrococcus sp. Hf6]WNY23720.1 hypothetical protein MmiHf6_10340 [Methanimicrococcus sp. Hf6]
MVCIKNLEIIIIGSEMTLSECEELILEKSDEVWFVPGGYELLGILLKGSRPFPVGITGENLYFQYVKPCFGIFALHLENCKEIEALKDDFLKNGFEKVK